MTIEIDQDGQSGDWGAWSYIGSFPFAAGTSGCVEISDAGVVPAPAQSGTTTYVTADAIRWVLEP